MKFISVQALKQSRYPIAIAAGLLLAISFPKTGIAGFAWIAPTLMLAGALGKRGVESFRIGYVAGLAHYLASLHWLLFIPVTGFPILGWVALSGYLALYPAAWVALALKVSGARCQVSGAGGQGSGARGQVAGAGREWLADLEAIASWNWTRRMAWAVSCAAIWVALEMILTRFLGGFPWNLLGVSQHRLLPLIQIASVTGVYGVSFLVVWTSVSLLCAAAVILSRPNVRSVWIGEIILPFLTLVTLFGFGFHQLRQRPAPGRELNVTLVQPSIPQTLIWNPDRDTERFQNLIRLSELALANRTDLLIWPEAGIPKELRYDREILQAVTNLAVQHHVWMIVGSDDAEPSKHSSDPKDAEYFNSSFLVSPQGRLIARYDKRNLVIFGEYIPLEHWLPFVKWFTPVQSSFTAGDRSVPFELMPEGERPSEPKPKPKDGSPGVSSHPPVKTSVLICFEDTFSQLAREGAETDTDFLVNITNDGWFGEGTAQWQHAATALFRAVENGLPLVRCTNTGLTCWYDANGRLREWFTDQKGTIYGAGFMTVKIPLLPAGERRPETFYNRHGDWFGWGCVALAAAALVRATVGNRHRPAP